MNLNFKRIAVEKALDDVFFDEIRNKNPEEHPEEKNDKKQEGDIEVE